jgi:DNA-binding NarL/FixJ family response regulator
VSAAAASSSGGAPIKVLLADDQVLVRSGFKVLLDAEDDITVVGEVTSLPSARSVLCRVCMRCG